MNTFRLFPFLSLGLIPSIASADSAETYTQVCAVCHGAEGAGDGVAAAGLPVAPADFTDTAFWEARTDTLVYKAIKEGGPAVGKSALMAPYKGTLSDDEIVAMVRYLRTLKKLPMLGELDEETVGADAETPLPPTKTK